MLLALGVEGSLRVELFLVGNDCIALVLSDSVKSGPFFDALHEFVDGRRSDLCFVRIWGLDSDLVEFENFGWRGVSSLRVQ